MIKLGVLGGTRGIELTESGVFSFDNVRVTCVCEKFEPLHPVIYEKCKKVGVEVKIVTDFDEMLASEVDAVILANYANEHAPYAIRALNAGKHVLSEVVPVQNPAEAVQLIEAVEKSGKIYAYSENYCYQNTVLDMKNRIANGDIGKICMLEGAFINDCSTKWPRLTRGERNHWRNYVPSTFYCTHSIGPLLYMSGERVKTVSGREIPLMPYMAKGGARTGSAAVELMELSSGAIAYSMHGNLKRNFSTYYHAYGEYGSLHSDPFTHEDVHSEIDRDWISRYAVEDYKPEFSMPEGKRVKYSLGGHSEFYAQRTFFENIENGKSEFETIDVYRALDMSLPGLMAYRSVLQGGAPVEVPDLRDKALREKYRNDYYCTDKRVGKEFLLPEKHDGNVEVDESVYENVQKLFKEELK